jgi:CheY-like chemotaxis protein
MVHGIAEQFGGALQLKSELGRGTTAELWLPCAEESAPTHEAANASAVDLNPDRSLRILVVDDDALVLASTVAMLEDLGYSVVAANSGSLALAALRSPNDFDVLLTDHAMPNMTGVELISEVHAQSLPVATILVSGYAELPAQLPAETLRLPKPFDQNDIARAIATVTQGRRGIRSFNAHSGL